MSDIKVYPVGRCIYCHADNSECELTDEHVIPYALNGWLVLQKASCKRCASITGAIEQRCLRGMLLEARTHLKMKTRRPKQRPNKFPIITDCHGKKEITHLPISENPMLLRLPILAEPSALSGKTAGDWVIHLSPMFWTFVGANTPAQRANINRCRKEFDYSPGDFVLFLGKIAYATAIAYKGYGTFVPIMDKIIVERSSSICDFVGGCPNPLFEERDTSLHVNVRTGKDFVRVEICLFAHLGAPYYQVIVGKP